MVEKVRDVVDPHSTLGEQIENDTGIDRSGSRPHRQPFQRCEPHRRRDALALPYGAHTAAVAEVRDHDAAAPRVTHDAGQDTRDVLVREAVEAVALDSRRGEVTRQRIELRHRLLGAMECGIEARDLGEAWRDSPDRAYRGEVVGL